MRRAPARPVRACFVQSCCNVVVQEHDLHATPVQCNAKRWLSSHLTLHSSHPALRTSHLHFALDTWSHLKSSELFSPHLSSSHFIPSLLTCHQSKFFSTVFISSEHWSTFLISSKFVSTHLSCSARQKALSVREKSLAKKTLGAESFCTQTLETQMHVHTLQKPSRKTLYYKACTKHFPTLLCNTKLAQSTFQYYYIYLYYKACTKHFPVLLCTTKLAQSTSQYYFVLQSLHKALPSTTLYYKACTKRVPVLLVLQSLHKALPSTTSYYKASTKNVPVLHCTIKLAQTTSQYYFALQSLHSARSSATTCTTKLAQSTSQYYFFLYYKACTKHFPVLLCTSLYYKACTKHFPVLLCTTKLAQSTSQHYFVLQSLHKALPSTTLYIFVLQSLHKALPSTTLYYKACTMHVPVLLLVLQSLHKALPSTTLYYKASSTTLYYKACTVHVPVLLLVL